MILGADAQQWYMVRAGCGLDCLFVCFLMRWRISHWEGMGYSVFELVPSWPVWCSQFSLHRGKDSAVWQLLHFCPAHTVQNLCSHQPQLCYALVAFQHWPGPTFTSSCSGVLQALLGSCPLPPPSKRKSSNAFWPSQADVCLVPCEHLLKLLYSFQARSHDEAKMSVPTTPPHNNTLVILLIEDMNDH